MSNFLHEENLLGEEIPNPLSKQGDYTDLESQESQIKEVDFPGAHATLPSIKINKDDQNNLNNDDSEQKVDSQPGIDLLKEVSELKNKVKYLYLGIIFLLVIVIGLFLFYALAMIPTVYDLQLTGRMKTQNILTHLQAFQNIALNFSNSRSPIYGYNASAAYVMNLLNSGGYKVSQQYFDVYDSVELQPSQLTSTSSSSGNATFTKYTNGKDFQSFMFQGSGNVTGKLFKIPSLGCQSADFQDFPSNGQTIALLERGNCTFRQKVLLAVQAGAIACLVYNNEPSLVAGTLGGVEPFVNIPVLGILPSLSSELLAASSINVFSLTQMYHTVTFNVIADSPTGNDHSIIVVGAHLDSVSKGPGINDNGSGSGMILEMALQLVGAGSDTATNLHPLPPILLESKVRFCFWAAEELGLLGSNYYVEHLPEQEKEKIVMNLNFDMIASPNFKRGVYNASSATVDSVQAPSLKIQKIFEEFYQAQGLDYELSDFDGRSDYQAFVANGIPSGGLDSGAEGLKTPAQVKMYGGIAGLPFDPCYHLACDVIYNVNIGALESASQCSAYALSYFATHRDLKVYLNTP